jgi:hypothetical protein
MKRKHKTKTQKMYRMRGCSKKMRKCKGGKTKKYLGGNSCGAQMTNINAANPIYPNSGPPSSGFNFLNSQTIRGGCGCNQLGGRKCRKCKRNRCTCKKRTHKQKGGNNGLPYGENLPPMKGIPYPDGLVGEAWTPNSSTWGVGNHYQLNTYSPNDVSRQMVDLGAQPPFTGGGWKKNKKGGAFINSFLQDTLNLGRSIQNGIGSTYNILNGYSAPSNPLPWKDQL